MHDDSNEKQHQASSKRLEDLKKEGQTLRSRDFSGALVLSASLLFFIFSINSICRQLYQNFVISFSSVSSVLSNDQNPFRILLPLLLHTAHFVLPLLLFICFIILITPFLFGGWNFTFNALQVKWERLNIITNLGNMFSKKTLINLLLSIVKVLVISLCLVMTIHARFPQIRYLANFNLASGMLVVEHLLRQYFMQVIMAVFAIAGMDMLYHYFSFQQNNKMSLQELKEEQKDTDGNMHTKKHMRMRQIALTKQRLSITVPKASVVITNPTHYAIAIAYEKGRDNAPRVVAKGKDVLANNIRAIAQKHHIPIVESATLARAVYHTTKLGGEIHPALYVGVAVVLSYIMQLKQYNLAGGSRPIIAGDLQIPKEFIFND